MPDPQAQEVPLLHGSGRQALPEPAGPRLQGGGPDDQAGDRRHRIQGGRHEALPFARGGPLQRRGRRLLDIQVPEHEDGPRDAGGPRGQARWRRRPVAAFGHGLAVPDARLQARA